MTPVHPTPRSIPPDYGDPEDVEDPSWCLALKSCSRLPLDRPLVEGQHVELWVSGRCKGLQRVEHRTTYLVECLDAEVRPPERRA